MIDLLHVYVRFLSILPFLPLFLILVRTNSQLTAEFRHRDPVLFTFTFNDADTNSRTVHPLKRSRTLDGTYEFLNSRPIILLILLFFFTVLYWIVDRDHVIPAARSSVPILIDIQTLSSFDCLAKQCASMGQQQKTM